MTVVACPAGTPPGVPAAASDGAPSSCPATVAITRTVWRTPAVRPVMVWLVAGASPGAAGATTACRATAYSCAPDFHCTL